MIKQIDTIERYVDMESNARVDIILPQLTQDGKEIPEADIEAQYVGSAMIGSPDGQQQMPIQFQIKEVADIDEAFEKFQESAEARLEEMEQEYLEQQRQEASAICGPDGKPLSENETGNVPLIFPQQ